MKSSDVLVYKGQAFSIEWYFDERGHCPAREYYEGLSDERRIKFLRETRQNPAYASFCSVTALIAPFRV